MTIRGFQFCLLSYTTAFYSLNSVFSVVYRCYCCCRCLPLGMLKRVGIDQCDDYTKVKVRSLLSFFVDRVFIYIYMFYDGFSWKKVFEGCLKRVVFITLREKSFILFIYSLYFSLSLVLLLYCCFDMRLPKSERGIIDMLVEREKHDRTQDTRPIPSTASTVCWCCYVGAVIICLSACLRYLCVSSTDRITETHNRETTPKRPRIFQLRQSWL